MSTTEPDLVPRAAFAGLVAPLPGRQDLHVIERDGLGLARLQVRKGQLTALTRRLRDDFNIELPSGPRWTVSRQFALLGIGPETWLAVSEQGGGHALAASLKEALRDLASVCDQSDAYGLLRLSGLKARECLARLLPVDVHPRAFKVGDVAATVAAHIEVIVWRLEDADEGAPVFEVAVPRSLAVSFWHGLWENTARPF